MPDAVATPYQSMNPPAVLPSENTPLTASSGITHSVARRKHWVAFALTAVLVVIGTVVSTHMVPRRVNFAEDGHNIRVHGKSLINKSAPFLLITLHGGGTSGQGLNNVYAYDLSGRLVTAGLALPSETTSFKHANQQLGKIDELRGMTLTPDGNLLVVSANKLRNTVARIDLRASVPGSSAPFLRNLPIIPDFIELAPKCQHPYDVERIGEDVYVSCQNTGNLVVVRDGTAWGTTPPAVEDFALPDSVVAAINEKGTPHIRGLATDERTGRVAGKGTIFICAANEVIAVDAATGELVAAARVPLPISLVYRARGLAGGPAEGSELDGYLYCTSHEDENNGEVVRLAYRGVGNRVGDHPSRNRDRRLTAAEDSSQDGHMRSLLGGNSGSGPNALPLSLDEQVPGVSARRRRRRRRRKELAEEALEQDDPTKVSTPGSLVADGEPFGCPGSGDGDGDGDGDEQSALCGHLVGLTIGDDGTLYALGQNKQVLLTWQTEPVTGAGTGGAGTFGGTLVEDLPGPPEQVQMIQWSEAAGRFCGPSRCD